MTSAQERTVNLLYKLGSNPTVTRQSGINVYVGSPWEEDRNPNVEVFPDGCYYDYSASALWEEHKLRSYGNGNDLEELIARNIVDEWEAQLKIGSGEHYAYKDKRKLFGDIRFGEYMGRKYLAFKMVDPANINKIVGIQRRFIDKEKPKNMMSHGSNGNGIFINNITSKEESGSVFIMEGATDTYTKTYLDGMVIGAPSVSMLNGVISYVYSPHKEPINAIYLCFDNDDAGRTATKKLAERFKKDFTVFVLDHQEGMKDVNDIVAAELELKFYEYVEPEQAQISFMDFHDEPIYAKGYRLGLPECFTPNMERYGNIPESGGTAYVAESFGLQKIYELARLHEQHQFIVVRRL